MGAPHRQLLGLARMLLISQPGVGGEVLNPELLGVVEGAFMGGRGEGNHCLQEHGPQESCKDPFFQIGSHSDSNM